MWNVIDTCRKVDMPCAEAGRVKRDGLRCFTCHYSGGCAESGEVQFGISVLLYTLAL